MFTIPTPPSDNFYKFMTVSGVILVASSSFLTMNWIELSRREKTTADIAKLERYQRVAIWTAEGKEISPEVYKDRASTLKTIIDYESQMAKADNESRVTIVNGLSPRLDLAVALGFGTMALGLALWYFKVQKRLDQLQLLELTRLQAELDTKKEPQGEFNELPAKSSPNQVNAKST